MPPEIAPMSDLLRESVAFLARVPKAAKPLAERGPSSAKAFLAFAEQLIVENQAEGVLLPLHLIFGKWLSLPETIPQHFTNKSGIIAKTPLSTVNRDLSVASKSNTLPPGWTYVPAKDAPRSDTVKAAILISFERI